jgi:hypothetical protein
MLYLIRQKAALEDNIKWILGKMVCWDGDWIEVAQDSAL